MGPSRATTWQRAVALAALLVCGALTLVLVWPREDVVVEWSEADLEAAPADDVPVATSEVMPRTEIPPNSEDGDGTERSELPEADGTTARRVTVRGRVVDTAAAPVAGATVLLELAGGARERMRKPATTAQDGTFALRGPLREGRTLSVLALHRHHAPVLVDREVPFGGSDELTVGDIVLGRGASIAGSVTDPSGRPLAAALAELIPDSGQRLLWTREVRDGLRVEPTDGSGSFEFRHVPPGSYRVAVQAPRHVPATTESFAVLEDERETLPPIALAAGCLLTGRVVDRDGRGVDRATVTVSARDGPRRPQRAVTDADGRFEVDGLPPGTSEVRVFAPGHVSHRQHVTLQDTVDLRIVLERGLVLSGVVRSAATGAAVEAFAVRARRVRALPPPMPEEFAGRSREELQALLATATSDGGAARAERVAVLRQALHAVAARETGERGLPHAQDPGVVEPHPGGRFECGGLDEGVYVIDVKAPNHVLTCSDEIELRTGMQPPPVEVVLARGHEVRGTVVRASGGEPVAGARVEIHAASATSQGRSLRSPVQGRAITATDGSFALPNVRPGRFVLRATAQGLVSWTGQPFELADDLEGVRIYLTSYAVLHGRVRGLPTDEVEGVTVVVSGGSTNSGIKTRRADADGSYRIADLHAGSYHVAAYTGDSATAVRGISEALRAASLPPPDVVLSAGEERRHDLDLVLVPRGGVRGHARVNGAPASGYQVRLVSPDRAPGSFAPRPTHLQQIEADGSFAFRRVEAGSYELRIASIARDRIELSRQVVTVVAGVETTVNVDLAVASLAGEVVAPSDRRPLEGLVKLRRAGSPEPVPSEAPGERTEIVARVHQGRFRIDVLPAGSFVLEHVPTDKRHPVRIDVDLARGEHRHVVVVAGQEL